MGQMVDADTAYITSRGLRTLGVRLRQHHESSLKVAEWLAEHPQVARVNHPALHGGKGHEFWKRDFTGSSGLFSFVLKKNSVMKSWRTIWITSVYSAWPTRGAGMNR